MLTSSASVLFVEPSEVLKRIISTQASAHVVLRPSCLISESSQIARHYLSTKRLVIHLDFTKIQGNSYDEVLQSYINYMASVYKEYYHHVKTHLSVYKDSENEYLEIMEGKLNLFENCMSHCLLKNLLDILYDATKAGVVLIVDNIDCPVHCAGIDNIPALYQFFGRVYEATFKGGNELALHKGIMTGTLPVSTPNNITMHNLLEHQLRSHLRYLRNGVGYNDSIPTTPFITCLQEAAINYFLGKNRVAGNAEIIRKGLVSLLNGENVIASDVTVNDRYNYHEAKRYKPGDVWRTLFFLGLLTLNTSTIDSVNQGYRREYELCVSNAHSKEYIQSRLNDWLAVLGFEREKKLEL